MHYTKKNVLYVLMVILIFVGGFFIGVRYQGLHTQDDSKLVQQQNDNYTFTNPLLDCDVQGDYEKIALHPIQNKIQETQSGLIKEGLASHISVYFRDLTGGGSVGVKVNEEFTPASLLKVPLMMAYLKLAEKDPAILQKELVYNPDPAQHILPQNIKPSRTIESGKKYTIDQLLSYMIVDSDNNAQTLLYNNIQEFSLDAVYNDLNISIPGTKSTEDYMSVREYASFFRILYNSTYLNRDMSEKALELLSHVDFDAGIRAGIPAGVPLANKFGERKVENEEGRQVTQLHDCGIVYYPKKPYLLCIMTRGDDFTKLITVISRISKTVFDQVSKL